MAGFSGTSCSLARRSLAAPARRAGTTAERSRDCTEPGRDALAAPMRVVVLVEGRFASGRRAVDVLIVLFVALEGFSFKSSRSLLREWKLSRESSGRRFELVVRDSVLAIIASEAPPRRGHNGVRCSFIPTDLLRGELCVPKRPFTDAMREARSVGFTDFSAIFVPWSSSSNSIDVDRDCCRAPTRLDSHTVKPGRHFSAEMNVRVECP